jgi:hypothetical protein
MPRAHGMLLSFLGGAGDRLPAHGAADMKVSDLVEIDGRLWVGAGLGKDGRIIRSR